MVLILVLIIAILIYWYVTTYNYWSKRNVKHDRPMPFIGTHFQNTFAYKSITDVTVDCYKRYPNEKVVGYYRWSKPELIVKDPEIIKNILTTDFAYFHRRGLGRNPEVESLTANLFHVDGDTWKLLRQRLTPAFTTAKLKNMFPLIVRCAEKLEVVCDSIVSRGGECDVRELMARFTTEFIGACGFGIEMDTINNEQCLFRDLGKIIFTRRLREMIRMSLWEAFPLLRKRIYVSNPKIKEIITEIVQKIRQQRNYKPCGRNDFLDLLLDLESQGKIKGESIEKRNSDGSPVEVELEMNLKIIVAQIFVFFAAGFETSSSATSFTLHELAYNPAVQKRIQEQIDEVLSKYNNKLCYESISKMSLLDMAFKESMRMFPSLGILSRVCVKRYTIPSLGLTIDPGVKILMPIEAIHNDEQYFDNPGEYKPERFSPEESKQRNHYTYLPFGEGPRMCIGLAKYYVVILILHNQLSRFYMPEVRGTYADVKEGHEISFPRPVCLHTAHANSPICRMLASLSALLAKQPECDVFSDEWDG